VLLIKYYFGVEIRGYISCIGEMRKAYKILAGKYKRKDHLEEESVDGRTILKYFLEKQFGEFTDWICLAWDRDHLQAFVNNVMKHRFL